jgi:transcriptional regulator with PAS, ATPase and Fis domain
MVSLDGTIVTVALPQIQKDFNTSVSGLQWLIDIYILFLTIPILVAGSLSDSYGRRKLFKPDTLLESELFGHKRGAFTGAHADKKGLFEFADGGTIFLDEVGETEPGMQVRLLRVLQDGEIRPLGSSETRRVDVRIIAATNKDLKRQVQEDRFREDLYYRLRVVEIELPPLRERREDIPTLAHHFLDKANERMTRKLGGFTNAAVDRLTAHAWSGNVRELENEIQRAVALAPADAETVSVEMLSEHVRGAAPAAPGTAPLPVPTSELNVAVDALKRAMIEAAIQETGSKTRAAEQLGIPRQSLQKMMKRLASGDGSDEEA